MREVKATIVALLVACSPVFGADTPAPPKPDFVRDIYPILQRSCFECHGPEKQKGKLRLDSREAAFKASRNGVAIVPGKAESSELYRRIILPKGAEGIMPARGETLTPAQIASIRDWINQGAVWPDGVVATQHWAYRKPVRPTLPIVKDASWPRTPIDQFVATRLEREGLKPSPEADRARLIRRVYLDLVGLPPSPAEVDAFLADSSPDAYDKVVDRLLASSHFGERWARPWLDLARYADSHGFQRDDLRDIWAYRDWVIRALNADMPFDQFTLYQMAGDLLPNATEEQKTATGFHRCTPTNVEAGSDPEETRVNQVIDRVNTTAAVWLGSTLECAQCHDHKYDPFKQRDYYQLFAYFNSTAIEADRSNPKVPGSIRFLGPMMSLQDPARETERQRLRDELRRLDEALAVRSRELERDRERWEQELARGADGAGQTHVLEVANFVSVNGSPHKVLKDHSILLVDDPPDRDVYTITVNTKLTGIRAFKLETLADSTLPGMGPGRGDAERPNFVLNSFTIKAAAKGKQAAPVKLVKARADFSQKNYDVDRAIGDDAKLGWAIAPQFHRSHWAIFETEKPIGEADGITLTFTLSQQFGKGRTIGRLRLSALTGKAEGISLPADVAKALQTAVEKRSDAQKKSLRDYQLEQDPAGGKLKEQRGDLARSLETIQPITTLAMQELAQPRRSNVFMRGNFLTPGIEVKPGAPAVLHALPEGPANRLTLARWLVHRDNPLVARVTVNRWWAELFGRGIVSTVEDFGVKGEAPTHPELLDWLAVEFMDNGWSMKRALRTMVLSATYRQSSALTAELRARDDQNLLLARGPRFRLDAETIRDNALTASGLLCRKAGGPPIRPFQPEGLWIKIGGAKVEYRTSPGEERHRRGVYVVWKRGAPYPSFVNFDATARLACTVKRSRSNTPLQALTLLNDPVYVEAALALARRTLTDCPDADVDARITHAFRLCLARAPSAFEVRTLHALFDAQREAGQREPKAVAALLQSMPLPAGVRPAEFAAWYAVASALLNLDEMITKG
jgi:hypothetical protein